MKRMIILMILVISVVISINTSFYGEYVILREPQTMNYYEKPNGKAVQLINEEIMGTYSNRLVYLEYETNIEKTKWAFMPDPFNILSEKRLKNVWIKLDETIYHFSEDKQNGELYSKLLRDAKVIKNEEGNFKRAINLSIANYFDGKYIYIPYTVPEEGEWEPMTYLYLKYSDNYFKAIVRENIFKDIYFFQNYILFSSSSGMIDIYNTEINQDKFDKGRPFFNLLDTEGFFSKIPDNIRDSYTTFDTNNGILTAYLRMDKDKPFVVEKYKFDNGKFKPLESQPFQTYTITGDNVNVRAEAATNGAVLVKLSKGAKVTLLKRSDVALTVGDKKGFWAFIDTGIANKDGEGTIKGWVFDYYLKEEK